MNQKTLDALSSAIYVSKLSLAGQTVAGDDRQIRASGLRPDWTPGSYAVGDICNTRSGEDLDASWDQTWECCAAYDNAVYPDIRPGNDAWYTFNRPLHGTSPETARPFVQPQYGTTDMYHVGEYMTLEGILYRCKQDTNFSPADFPAAWEVAV